MGAARQRGIRLHYLPGHFTRHKDNTTFLNYKTKRLEWRVEWIFPQAENLCLVSDRYELDSREKFKIFFSKAS